MTKGCFIGHCCVDFIYYIEDMPKENNKIKTNTYNKFVGGPAANAAITYSMLGGEAYLITHIGNSELGLFIKSNLLRYNVNVIDLCTSEQEPSISTILINKKNGNRTIISGQQTLKQYIDLSKYTQDKYDFYFTDCNIYKYSIEYIKMISKNKKPIILDLGSWKEYNPEFIQFATDIIASSNCNNNYPDFEKYFFNLQHKYLAITNGEQDIKYKDKTKIRNLKINKINAIDTLAAGDIFHGAYCFYKYSEKYSFLESLKKSTKIAMESVKYNGPRGWIKNNKNNKLHEIWLQHISKKNFIKSEFNFSSNIVGEYGEFLIKEYLDCDYAKKSEKSYDLLRKNKIKYQVKTRISKTVYSNTLGIIRTTDFDYLIIVLFSIDGQINKVSQISQKKINKLYTHNKYENGFKISTTKKFLEECRDITSFVKDKNRYV
jgi:sugar/nucleoside kinase (ribokinase family)